MIEREGGKNYIFSLPRDQRRTLKDLIEQWCAKQDIQERIGAHRDEFEQDVRFCWAIHTEKTVGELIGRADVVTFDEIADLALSDDRAAVFGGVIEGHVIFLLKALVENSMSLEPSLCVHDTKDPSVNGTLLLDSPLAILRIAERPSSPYASEDRIASRDDWLDEPVHRASESSIPPIH
jgi:hypothetical protein